MWMHTAVVLYTKNIRGDSATAFEQSHWHAWCLADTCRVPCRTSFIMQRLLQCERQEAERLRARIAELELQVATAGKGAALAAVRAGEAGMEE